MTDVGEISHASREDSGVRYRAGDRLGRYELLMPIGSGGMAIAWIARLRGEAGFSKLVAIKTMLPHLVDVIEARRMLFDEARVASRIHHPNVVAIQELGEHQGVPYLVMEWVNGFSLDRLLTGPLEAGMAARIVADACAGLHAAHELVDDDGRPLQVVHRDISPYNVLVSSDGAVKVADFGIAKARGQLHRTMSMREIRGRISYMAPEQVLAEPLDRRTDVFAMGATLHEALTGEPAFSGDNDAQVVFKIAQATYEPPANPVANVGALFGIVSRALARSAEDRFGTAEEMRLALESWLTENAPPVVTSSSIAGVVRGALGHELEQRQVQLRKALNAEAVGSTPRVVALQGFVGDSPGLADSAPPARAKGAPLAVGDPEGASADAAAPPPLATSAVTPFLSALARGGALPWATAATALVLGIGAWVTHHQVAAAYVAVQPQLPTETPSSTPLPFVPEELAPANADANPVVEAAPPETPSPEPSQSAQIQPERRAAPAPPTTKTRGKSPLPVNGDAIPSNPY